MSNLSELLPAGAGAKSADFVASGTLGSGVTVALNSDGTVEAVAVTPVTGFTGSRTNFTLNTINTLGCDIDQTSGKVVIAYTDVTNSNYGTAIVGTISGTSITFGTPVVFRSSAEYLYAVNYDIPSEKMVIAFVQSSSFKAVVGTVSGTSISFGAASTLSSGRYPTELSSTYDTVNNQVIYAFRDTSQDGYAVTASVSGTTVTFGTDVVFETNTASYPSITFVPDEEKVVIAYRSNIADYGVTVVGTVSGSSLSFGSTDYFNFGTTSHVTCVYDTQAQKVLVACRDGGFSNYARMVVGTIFGTSVTFGSEVTLRAADSENLSSVYDSNSKVCLVAVRSANSGFVYEVSISGTTPSVSGTISLGIGCTDSSIAFDPVTSNSLVAYRGSTTNKGEAFPFRLAYNPTNYTDFIGITDQAIANTATGAVIVQGGVSEKVSGLTAGSDYYVQADGSLSTTVSSAPAGRALSSTSILLEG